MKTRYTVSRYTPFTWGVWDGLKKTWTKDLPQRRRDAAQATADRLNALAEQAR
jgi:hypothetical protein